MLEVGVLLAPAAKQAELATMFTLTLKLVVGFATVYVVVVEAACNTAFVPASTNSKVGFTPPLAVAVKVTDVPVQTDALLEANDTLGVSSAVLVMVASIKAVHKPLVTVILNVPL